MRSQQVGGNSLRTLFIEAIVIQASLGALLISWEDTSPMHGPVLEQPGIHASAGTTEYPGAGELHGSWGSMKRGYK